jgi:D-cysteine desulfhydrase
LKLAKLPTPLDDVPRLTREVGDAVGPRILIKRDDLTGLAGGGNKTRKLEYLLADAIDRHCDVVITAGGPQSNHCRQTAAACAVAGLECHLVLGGEPAPPLGNLLLDRLLGARVHWTPKTLRRERMEELAAELAAAGRRPAVFPVGGSTGLGAIGYVGAMFELIEQLDRREVATEQVHIVFATSSGGTQAGVVLGARLAGFRGRITAISIDQFPDEVGDEKFLAGVVAVAEEASSLLDRPIPLSPADFSTNYDYLGEGYGVVGELEREAIRRFARTEGLILGPVYTARAAGGMLDLIRRGALQPAETVVFWHTGDDVAVHAYARELLAD